MPWPYKVLQGYGMMKGGCGISKPRCIAILLRQNVPGDIEPAFFLFLFTSGDVFHLTLFDLFHIFLEILKLFLL